MYYIFLILNLTAIQLFCYHLSGSFKGLRLKESDDGKIRKFVVRRWFVCFPKRVFQNLAVDNIGPPLIRFRDVWKKGKILICKRCVPEFFKNRGGFWSVQETLKVGKNFSQSPFGLDYDHFFRSFLPEILEKVSNMHMIQLYSNIWENVTFWH